MLKTEGDAFPTGC